MVEILKWLVLVEIIEKISDGSDNYIYSLFYISLVVMVSYVEDICID